VSRASRRRRRAAFLTGVLLAVGAGPAAASGGAVAARPLPAADAYRAYSAGAYSFPVLANDRVGGLFPGELTLCGVSVDAETQQSLYAEIDRTDPTRVYVEVDRTAEGIVTFTYDACEGGDRRSTTVLVDIVRLDSPAVAKPRGSRGVFTATNPNDARLTIQWGGTRESVADGRRAIRPGRTVRIEVTRSRIYWVAYLRDQGSLVVAGDGVISGIKKAGRRR
jgi:hypothetical protein